MAHWSDKKRGCKKATVRALCCVTVNGELSTRQPERYREKVRIRRLCKQIVKVCEPSDKCMKTVQNEHHQNNYAMMNFQLFPSLTDPIIIFIYIVIKYDKLKMN